MNRKVRKKLSFSFFTIYQSFLKIFFIGELLKNFFYGFETASNSASFDDSINIFWPNTAFWKLKVKGSQNGSEKIKRLV
jgi:hypothetical protein